MKVKELINLLQKQDPESLVCQENGEHPSYVKVEQVDVRRLKPTETVGIFEDADAGDPDSFDAVII